MRSPNEIIEYRSRLDQPMCAFFGLRDRKGHLGIENEIEFDPRTHNAGDVIHRMHGKIEKIYETSKPMWKIQNDGSLRNGLELVLVGPLDMKDLPTAMEQHKKLLAGEKPIQSIRTSVHYHVNVSSLRVHEWARAAASYFLIEPFLIGTQPENRRGNLFCLGAKDAEFVVDKFVSAWRTAFKPGSLNSITSNEERYGALNFAALRKFCSMEFRFIAGTCDQKVIETWARALVKFVNTSKHVPLMDAVSSLTGEPGEIVKLMETYFEEHAEFLMKLAGPEWIDLVQKNLGYGMIFAQIENDLASLKIPEFRSPTIMSERDDPVEHIDKPKLNLRGRRDRLPELHPADDPGPEFDDMEEEPMDEEFHDDFPPGRDFDPEDEPQPIQGVRMNIPVMDELINPPIFNIPENADQWIQHNEEERERIQRVMDEMQREQLEQNRRR